MGNTMSCTVKLTFMIQGDSGGPLWTYLGTSDETRRAFLVGIVSRGSGCAVYNSPGIYTRVRAFVKWIDDARGNTSMDQENNVKSNSK